MNVILLHHDIPEIKKICIDEWLGKYYFILERIPAEQGAGEQVWFVPNTVGESGGSANLGEFCYFYSYLSWK